MRHELIDTGDAPPNVCHVDFTVVGGPAQCDGPLFMSHVVYPDQPDTCYDAVVCLAHTPHMWGFVATEYATQWYDLQVSQEPLPTPQV